MSSGWMRVAFFVLWAGTLGCRGQAPAVVEPSTYVGMPGVEQVGVWLESGDSRLQAWAAHDILEYKITSLLPELNVRLAGAARGKVADGKGAENFQAICAMLDTLIQMEATVSAEALSAVQRRGYGLETEELVLLSRLPAGESASSLLAFYKPIEANGSGATRVAAQLLALQPPRGFAAEVLQTVSVTAEFVVRDANSGWGISAGYGSACGGSGVSRPDPRWPEVGRYSFHDAPLMGEHVGENEVLFLDQIDSVYLMRTVGRTYYPGAGRRFSFLDDAKRSHLVGTMLGGSPASPLPDAQLRVEIEFTTREAYRKRVQDFVDEQERNFAQVASALNAKGLMSEKERQASALHMSMKLIDIRVQPAEDLPVISFRPPVEWVAAR